MSVANVSAVRVTNNAAAPADSSPSVVVDAANYQLSTTTIASGGQESYDLTTISGLMNGHVFTGRITIPSISTTANDNTQLTFVSNAGTRAIYIVGGNANAPSITYQGTEAL